MKNIKYFLLTFLLLSENIFAINTPEKVGIHGVSDILYSFIQGFVNIILPVMVLALVYVGFKFVASNGEPEKLKEAKNALMNVIIGIIIVLAGWAIYKVIMNVL